MKVTIVCDYFLPRMGGIESHIADLSQKLSENNDVTVVTATKNYACNKNKKSSVDLSEIIYKKRIRKNLEIQKEKIAKCDIYRLHNSYAKNFPLALGSDECLRKIFLKTDIVHVHFGIITPFSYKAIEIALSMKKPVLVTFHCMLGNVKNICKLFLPIAKWEKQGAVLTCVSEKLQKQINDTFGVHSYVLENAIDTKFWAKNVDHKDEISLDDNSFNNEYDKNSHSINSLYKDVIANSNDEKTIVKICASMRLNWRKRPLQLVKVFNAINKNMPENKMFILRIFGDGNLKFLLKMLIKLYRLEDKIFLMGKKDKKTLRYYYHNSDIYVTLALAESFGIASLEALASGMAIVVRDNTGAKQYLTDNVTGRMANSDKDVCKAILALIRDDELRNNFKKYNENNLPFQDWDNITQKTIEYYKMSIDKMLYK